MQWISKINSSFKSTILKIVFSACLLYIGGCSDNRFFDKRPTELESMRTLRELEEIKPTPGITNPKPELYSMPPLIEEITVAGNPEAKLYYFCKYHTPAELIKMINIQFVSPLNDHTGKPLPRLPYTISQNPLTEQIIAACPTKENALQVLEFLQNVDVPPIQIKIDCLVSEVYADHTMDWQTTMEIQNLFGGNISLAGYMPGAALRDAARNTFGLETGYVSQADQPGHKFSALIDLLVSRGYLKIMMNPQLEVVNGQTATISTIEELPLDNISDSNPASGVVSFRRDYANVVDSLKITPNVFSDGSIGLSTVVVTGSKSTPEGIQQTPIVTRREISVGENRVRSGESLLIGGIQKSEQRSVVRGIPFLKDLPGIGILFSSKDFEERGKEVLFIITPTISTNGVPNEYIIADLKKKHTPVRDKVTLIDNITDPFGNTTYTNMVEEEATNAEVRRVRAEMEKNQAERRAILLEEKLQKATETIQQQQDRSLKLESETENLKTEAEIEKAKAAQAEAEKKKIIEETKARIEAQKAQIEEAQKQKQQAEAQKAQAEKSKKDTESEIEAWMKAAQEKK